MTEESAFKRQVRARMAETGEKYTAARRIVVEDNAIRDLVRREFGPAGVSRIEIERSAERVRVDVHSVRPGLVVGPRGELADRVREELAALTGRRVSLNIWQLRGPDPAQHAEE